MKNASENKAPLMHKKLVCGLIMPLSFIEGFPETHWEDVKEIFSEAIDDAGFESQIVSDADEVGIIQNLYENPVVICDVSGKNPNVMFELGIRLAFDKPTIIVKDDKTEYSFDTSPIEHIEYPRDLRFAQIVAFKKELSEKIKSTHKKATEDENYTTFLKNFGPFTSPKLDTQEISKDQYVLEELKQLRGKVSALLGSQRYDPVLRPVSLRELYLPNCPQETVKKILTELEKVKNIDKIETKEKDKDHAHLLITPNSALTKLKALSIAKEFFPKSRLS